MEGFALPSYARARRHAAWRDAEGRLYADATAAAPPGVPRALVPECCYVMLPVGETRRRGAPGSQQMQIEFPEPGHVVSLTPVLHSSVDADAAADAVPCVVAAVERRELERAVALITWRAPAAPRAAPAWLR